MAYDYTDDAAFAVEMVAEFGRPVEFVAIAPAVDPAAPLAAPAGAPVVSSPVPAVFVYPTGVTDLGATAEVRDMLKAYEQIAIVAPSAYDYTTAQQIIDHDGSVWKIGRIATFKPGDTVLLYYVGVNR